MKNRFAHEVGYTCFFSKKSNISASNSANTGPIGTIFRLQNMVFPSIRCGSMVVIGPVFAEIEPCQCQFGGGGLGPQFFLVVFGCYRSEELSDELFLWYFGSPRGVNQSTRGIVYHSTPPTCSPLRLSILGGSIDPPSPVKTSSPGND